MRANEPVAYFVFDEKLQITFELDFKRPAKYILLLPTGFRQKPQAFMQNPDMVPMEIQFFGVSGQVIVEEQKVLDQIEVNDATQKLDLNVLSGFALDVELQSQGETAKFTIDNLKLDQFFVCDKNISAETLLQNKAVIGSNIRLEG